MDFSHVFTYNRLIREVANHFAFSIIDQPFLEEIIKKLKFSKSTDWTLLCSIMDTISDTELAKLNYDNHKLKSSSLDFGEQYLRLYGITNAIYLQKRALISLTKLVNLKNQKQVVNDFESLNIFKFRHIVGAHTVDLLLDKEKTPHQYQRGLLDNREIIVSNSNNEMKKYNLDSLILKYDVFAKDLISNTTLKFINNVFKDNGRKKKYFLKKLNQIQ